MPSPSLSGSAVDLVLHIGTGKTGSSSIQAFLRQNRAALADLGYLYPRSPGPRRHAHLSLFCMPDERYDSIPTWKPERWSSPAEFRDAFRRRLSREIDESGLSRVLLSDEGLYGSPNEALRRLRQLTDSMAAGLRLVVYLRRQDDHLVSRYQQVVKTGETRRLGVGTHADSGEQSASWKDRQGANTYDYYARLQTWTQLLEPTELVVRRFERESFAERSLYQDFLEATGIDARAENLDQVETANESLDAEAVEFLRILNIFRREHEEASALPANHPLVVRLARSCDGPTLTLPTSVLDEFMGRWEDSNQHVARQYFGDPTGRLFRTPRKTANTTAVQHLDPARLDHFLDVAELPKVMHAPVRKLAEREARVR
jgi:hypothetical protein